MVSQYEGIDDYNLMTLREVFNAFVTISSGQMNPSTCGRNGDNKCTLAEAPLARTHTTLKTIMCHLLLFKYPKCD